jgi:transposase
MVKCTKRQIRQLKTALHWKMPEAQRQRIQMILCESGMVQPAIAEARGVSLSTVNRAHMAYDHGGIKALSEAERRAQTREHDAG